jgi:hypothetical protein
MRSFDPRAVGRLEARAWETYYRREWRPFLVASVALVRSAFRMSWPKTLWGAWLVLRANQVWAPFPGNDPEKARRLMRSFYSMLDVADPARASELEVEWWRVHRDHQHEAGSTNDPLTEALAALYAHVYGTDVAAVRPAGALRAEAMDVSDRWVDAGCDPDSPMLDEERTLLVRSYASLLAAVHR